MKINKKDGNLTAKEFKQKYMNKAARTRAEQIFDLRKDLNSIIDQGGDMSFNAKKKMRSLRTPTMHWPNENPGKMHRPTKRGAVTHLEVVQ